MGNRANLSCRNKLLWGKTAPYICDPPLRLGGGMLAESLEVFHFFIDIGCGTPYHWNLRQKRSQKFFEILNDEKKSHSESLIDWIEEPDTN